MRSRHRLTPRTMISRATALCILICLLPILCIAAAAIVLRGGPGPILFRQQRVGQSGALFTLYKFRSMRSDTPDVESTVLNARAITPIGALLRRTNIDELPQLINVLRGEMRFVGPRPALPAQTELLTLRRMNGASELPPGLTGWAQVNAYDDMPLEQKARFDGEYAQQQTAGFNLRILVLTIGYLFKRPPTY